MTELENAISGHIPNLDCEIDVKSIEAMGDEFYKMSTTFIDLATYCEAKKSAMNCRMSGEIATALHLEKTCDLLYKNLLDWAKW